MKENEKSFKLKNRKKKKKKNRMHKIIEKWCLVKSNVERRIGKSSASVSVSVIQKTNPYLPSDAGSMLVQMD